MRGRTVTTLIHRYRGRERSRVPDALIVEEPLAIDLDGTLVATTMRTPGHDFELAVGYCFTDGLLDGAPVTACRYCGTGSAVETEFNTVTVETGGRAPTPTPRLTPTTSSCGLCGSATLDELAGRLSPLPPSEPFAVEALLEATAKARVEQELFSSTGGVHGAAAFDRDGSLRVVREDIGRHNAVDKVVGRLLLDDALPATDLGLFVSGRASFELVQKAWAAGFTALVAVSAPSALAVETARIAGLQLAGFARDDQLNLYAPEQPEWKRLNPELWVGPKPYGIGEQKPNHYKEMAEVAWTNRRHPRYAWKVLTKGVCDGCALGVAGLHDWTIEGVHLCTTRLRLLELNTADAVHPGVLADAEGLRLLSSKELRGLGRLGHPMRRRRGDSGFSRISWDEALDAISGALRTAGGDRTALFLTSRGITNEVYYVAGKAARALGVANVDSAARVCHAPSTVGLKQTIGAAASTCSLQDVIESDLIVLWGANPANNQPVFMKYLYLARKRGCRVVVVNPYLEPGLDRYWVPSNLESAMFGTKMCDLHVPVRPGGDVALANAALKRLIARGDVDEAFIADHTEGWSDLVDALEAQSLDDLLAAAGLTAEQLEAFVDEYAAAGAAVLIWSMGITQHRDSVDGVRSIVNLGLARGNVGRDGAGLMPIRGHSGVQGGAEMGAYATALPGGLEVNPENAAHFAEQWGFPVPDAPGLTAPEMIEGVERGELDVLWSSGGNFLEVLPDPPRVEAALTSVPLRIHQDIVISSQMLVPGDDVILLPVATRYEQEGGGTETTTERRIVFSPEIPRQVGEARSEWRLFADVVRRTRPELKDAFDWRDNQALRQEIAETVPLYAGIETLADTGDQVQWGGRHLAADGQFSTPSGRAHFTALTPPETDVPEGRFVVATRRGKQFNSMVFKPDDPLTGAARDAVFMDEADAAALGLADGAPVRLHADTGTYDGHVRLVRLPARTLQVHWPEGNVLIPAGPTHREPHSKVPDYNALVTLESLG